MATHDASIVDQMRKRVIELDDGRSCATRRRASTASSTDPRIGLRRDLPDRPPDQRTPSSMQLRYVFRGSARGLRRNLSMHVAVVLTLSVSLALVGFGVLLREQSIKATDQWGSGAPDHRVLCKARDDNPACTSEVTDAQKAGSPRSSATGGLRLPLRDREEEAFAKVKELLGADKFEGPSQRRPPTTLPESIWITLNDPDEYQGIESAIIGLDGVSSVRDQRDVVRPILRGMTAIRVGSLATAIAGRRGAAAGGQHDPAGGVRQTPRDRHHAAVGASTLYTSRCRSLMEALVTAAIALVFAIGALTGLHALRCERLVEGAVQVHPVDRLDQRRDPVVVMAILARR